MKSKKKIIIGLLNFSKKLKTTTKSSSTKIYTEKMILSG